MKFEPEPDLNDAENRMLRALLDSGVEIKEGKRYTRDDVIRFLRAATASTRWQEYRTMTLYACGCLLKDEAGNLLDDPPHQRETYRKLGLSAEAKIRAALQDCDETRWAYGDADGELQGDDRPEYQKALDRESNRLAELDAERAYRQELEAIQLGLWDE